MYQLKISFIRLNFAIIIHRRRRRCPHQCRVMPCNAITIVRVWLWCQATAIGAAAAAAGAAVV